MEHPAEILKKTDNSQTLRTLMSLFFQTMPTYENIVNETPKLQPLFSVSEEFKRSKSDLVRLVSLEWNTLEEIVTKWDKVFESISLPNIRDG